MANHLSEFGCESTVDGVQKRHLVDLVHETDLLCHLCHYTWWQIEVNTVYYFVGHLLVSVCHNESFGKSLTISFAATIMLDFDMEVLASFRSEELAATLVWTDVGTVDFLGCPTKVLLPLGLWGFRTSRLITNVTRILHSDAKSAFLFILLLNSSLSLFGLQQKLLLVLLLSKTMQEFVWLGQDLRYQSVLIEVFYVEDFAVHFIVLVSSLINIRHKVFILKVHTPELTIIVRGIIKNRWLICALNLLAVDSSDLVGRDASGPKGGLGIRTIEVVIVGGTWTLSFSEAMRWRRSERFLFHNFTSWQINLLSCEIHIVQIIVGM